MIFRSNMKVIALIFSLALVSVSAKGQVQKYVLLDRKFKKNATWTDTVMRQHLSEGWFPIHSTELDSLVIFIDKLRNLKEDGMHRKFYYSDDFKTSHLKLVIENIKRAYGDGYEINLISSGDFGEPTIKLADPRENLGVNQATIRTFLAYLKRVKKQEKKN